MSLAMGIRLFVMMFLQYAVWGTWAPVLSETLENRLGFTGFQQSLIYAAVPVACAISPFFAGQIADRYFPTQWFLAIAHLLGAAALYVAAQQQDALMMALWMLIHALFFAPTLALTNSLAFHHMTSTDKLFALVRVGGTVGWIVAGFALGAWRFSGHGVLDGGVDSLVMSAGIAGVLGLYCLTLPHTPPNPNPTNPFAMGEAFKLFKLVPGFAAFMAVSFIVTTELQFYYMTSAPYLKDLGFSEASLGPVKTIAQFAELPAMLLLPLAMIAFGMRKTLALGVFAWPVRYVVFAAGPFLKPIAAGLTLWLVAGSNIMHGIGYAFFFTASQIYVDKVAPRDIRASAQSLLALVTLGIGTSLGTFFTGYLKDFFTDRTVDPPLVSWAPLFLIPCVLTIICGFAFLWTFKDPIADPTVAADVDTVTSPAIAE